MNMPRLILASQSPRRKEILASLGVTFTTSPADVDESARRGETPLAYVQRIALAKAQKVADANPGCVVLAADTPVVVGRRILQKPESFDDACAMLRLQSGRRVHIPTAVVAIDGQGRVHRRLNHNWVKFRPLTEADITAYLSTPDNWQGLAGAVQVENPQMASLMVAIYGSYSGILGLPLYDTRQLLAASGISVA